MGDFFRGIGNSLSSAAEWTGQTAKSVGSAAWDGTVAAGRTVRDGAVVAGTAVRDGAVAAGTAVRDGAVAAGTAVRDGAVVAGTAVRDGAVATGTAVRDGTVIVWDAVAEPIKNTGATLGALSNIVSNSDAPMRPQIGKTEGYPGGLVETAWRGRWAACEEVPPQIKVKIPFQRGAQGPAAVANAQTGAQTTLQTPGSSFLYLDVGRWGGTGSDGRRDFGIVCGRTAALCAFPQGSGNRQYERYSGAKTTLDDGPRDEIDPINKLLGQLASSPLGAPQVRRYLWAKAPLLPGAGNFSKKVYVVVGDMHLPVVTRAGPDGRPLPSTPQPAEQSELHGRRVGRIRRGHSGNDMGIMPDSDAVLWHEAYLAGEIFQEAGEDLVSFADMLTAAKDKIGADLWLLQLGDMFDLWLGLDCFFQSDPPLSSRRPGNEGRVKLQEVVVTPTPPTPPTDSTAMAVAAMGAGMAVPMIMPAQDGTRLEDLATRTATTPVEFVETWIHSTIYKTSQGPSVQKFLQFDPRASVFLYGNHDNYLGAHAVPDLVTLRGQGIASKEHYDRDALFYACHGHQWDKYNRDGALAGQGTTQAAFWGGQLVRGGEGLLDGRDPVLLGAVGLHRGGKDFNVFAMGHTHVALLTEIVIEMEPEPAPVEYAPMPIM
jgi:hypothetical protein